MKKTACALLLVLASLRVEASVVLRIWVEPPSQLPFIAPSLRVEAVNTSSTPAELPLTVALQVMPSDGKPFIAHLGPPPYVRITWFRSDDDDAASILLAPDETRDLSFWAGPASPVTADSRLLSPGTYRFQLVAHDKLNSDLLEGLDRVADQRGGLTDPILSNEATYVVETPEGEDAAVWELIKQLLSPTLWGDSLGSRIWAEHPSSRYAAFCFNDPKTNDPDVSIAAYTATLAKQPDRAWADRYRLGIARDELTRSSKFVDDSDAEGAFQAKQRAKSILTQLAREGLSPYLREEAQDLLDTHIWTREEIVHFIKRLNNELIETEPFAICVENTDDGKHIFWFGYHNYTQEPMRIAIGRENKFTPPPFDRGQPTVFPRGDTLLGVRIVTHESAVTWHLMTHDVQASLAESRPCPADMHERFKYEPPQRD